MIPLDRPSLSAICALSIASLAACDKTPAAPQTLAPTAAPSVQMASPSGDFEVMLEDASTLIPAEGDLFVIRGRGTKLTFYKAEDAGLRPLPTLAKGLPPEGDPAEAGAVERIAGRFPDALWLSWRVFDDWSAAESRFRDTLYRFRVDHWEALATTDDDEVYQTFWEAGPGCLVGLLANSGFGQGATKARQAVLDCPANEVPRLPYPGQQNLRAPIREAIGTPSGALFLLQATSPARGADMEPARLVRWGPGESVTKSVAIPLPSRVRAAVDSVGLLSLPLSLAGPSEVVFGGTYAAQIETPQGNVGRPLETFLMRSDGESVRPVEGIVGCDHDGLSLAKDGALFVLSATSAPCDAKTPRRVVLRRADGTTQDIGDLPADPTTKMPMIARHIAARSASEVWIEGETPSGNRLLLRWRAR